MKKDDTDLKEFANFLRKAVPCKKEDLFKYPASKPNKNQLKKRFKYNKKTKKVDTT